MIVYRVIFEKQESVQRKRLAFPNCGDMLWKIELFFLGSLAWQCAFGNRIVLYAQLLLALEVAVLPVAAKVVFVSFR